MTDLIFTGGDNLTGTQKLIHKAMMLNELEGGIEVFTFSSHTPQFLTTAGAPTHPRTRQLSGLEGR